MKRGVGIGFLVIAALTSRQSLGAVPTPGLTDRLASVRAKVMVMEQSLIDGLRSETEARRNIQKIQALTRLRQEERQLGLQRARQLEGTIAELQSRRGVLRERIGSRQREIRVFLAQLNGARNEPPRTASPEARERMESPRRKVLANLVEHGLKEIETLKVDLQDADQLEGKIQEEQQQLAYLFQELKEQESVLELNRQLQVDLLKKHREQRVAQLESYRKLKTSENQVESLIRDFNARRELERNVETERLASRSMRQGAFARLKGRLELPVVGKVVSFFGRVFDEKSSLNVFKKGVDIAAGESAQVRAISAGKVAFSGELPSYGRVTIIDHGDHYYSLCANLGELKRQAGDAVAKGDVIGASDPRGKPVYFEIRSRNIAVNPLQWVAQAR